MYNTVKMLIESSVLPKQDFIMENHVNFSMLREATENEKLAAKFTINKVPVSVYDGKYVIEFTDGVERVMENYNYDLHTAITEIARINKIPVNKCILVMDESTITKIDLSGLNKEEFEVVRR